MKYFKGNHQIQGDDNSVIFLKNYADGSNWQKPYHLQKIIQGKLRMKCKMRRIFIAKNIRPSQKHKAKRSNVPDLTFLIRHSFTLKS